ncbi:hypothetical protein AB0G04_42150 [Actinoplanes sp. NPDC023801]|uniref:hypothetical protein n=1 Tax=Actinoplanes sp. NPDC023801 TaxID=3154595 RepID=UPI0033E5F4B2
MGVTAKQVVAAIERYALGGGRADRVIVRPGGTVTVFAGRAMVDGSAAWRIGNAVRLREDTAILNSDPVHGVLFTAGGAMRLLNERATMDDLGRRLGDDLDPLAYAEVVAELFSGDDPGGPVVKAFAADAGWPAGELFTGSKVYPDPVVQRAGDRVRIHFFSGRGHIRHHAGGGHHVYRWRITGAPGEIPEWEREYVGFDGPDH